MHLFKAVNKARRGDGEMAIDVRIVLDGRPRVEAGSLIANDREHRRMSRKRRPSGAVDYMNASVRQTQYDFTDGANAGHVRLGNSERKT